MSDFCQIDNPGVNKMATFQFLYRKYSFSLCCSFTNVIPAPQIYKA